MKTILAGLFLFLLGTPLWSQQVYDFDTKQPIALALVYSKTSNFQTESTMDGHIDTLNLYLVADNDSIYIEHLFYEPLALLKSHFTRKDSIFLQFS